MRGAGAASRYEIEKKTEGVYHLVVFQSGAETLDEIVRVLKIDDVVLRHMATRHIEGSRTSAPRDDTPPPAAVAVPEPVAVPEAVRRPPRRSPSPRRSTLRRTRVRTRSRRSPMANINRVVLVGNLTQRPRAPAHAERQRRSASSASPSTPGRRTPRPGSGATSPTTSTSPSGATRPRAAPSTSSKGRPVGDRRAARLARVGGPGRRRSARRSRSSPTPSSSSAAAATAAAKAAATSSCRQARRRRAPTSRRRPTTTFRSRRETWPREKPQQQRKRPGGPAGAIKRRNCYFCKDKVAEIDYKNVNQLRRYISEKGKIRSRRITGACRRHQVQVATGGEAGPRDGAAAVRRGGRRGAQRRGGRGRDRGDRGDRGDR